jgi:hypothetical protein
MIASVSSIADARAKRAKRPKHLPPSSGLMSGRVENGRIQLCFNQPIESFHLSAAQARFWANALLTLADSAGT